MNTVLVSYDRTGYFVIENEHWPEGADSGRLFSEIHELWDRRHRLRERCLRTQWGRPTTPTGETL